MSALLPSACTIDSLSSFLVLAVDPADADADAADDDDNNAWLTLLERVIEDELNVLLVLVEVEVAVVINLRKYGTRMVSVMTRKHMAKDKHYCVVANGIRTLIKYTNRFKNLMSSTCVMYLFAAQDTINKRSATPLNAPSMADIRDR